MACEITEANVHDGTMLAPMLNPISEKIVAVTGDGAYEAKQNYEKVESWGATPLFPPPDNATDNKNSNPIRRSYVQRINELGGDEKARKKWKKETGYHKRSLAETGMFRFKAAFGDRLSSRTLENQKAEATFKAYLLNKMTNLGMPQSYPVE